MHVKNNNTVAQPFREQINNYKPNEMFVFYQSHVNTIECRTILVQNSVLFGKSLNAVKIIIIPKS